MLLRIFLFVLFLGLVYRVFRDLLRSSLRWAFTSRDGSRPTGRKPSWRINKDRVTDAEFRDLDS
ncbi:MAG: hypothetical protein OXH06_15590 [Gemmatimonadetes bacterium]|nr:hypothetical protein [Gemmatimonadota bacterium]MDE3256952.1 hypothetical protein [Gemmatimonadota bacterium]